MGGADGLQTKNLPLARWAEIVQGLRAAGYATAQLGAPTEHLVPGVELDLRGRTDLAATARALQHARLHVDTEGGLVHLARARRVPAIVLFGPTPPGFFGYPGNANLAPRTCGDCWWTARDWSARCPLGEEGPPCMASHEAADVLAALPGLARQPLRLEIAPALPLPPAASGAAAIAAALGRHLAALPGAALVLDAPELLEACLAEPSLLDAAPRLLVPSRLHAAAVEAAAGRLTVQPMAPGFIPAGTGDFPAAFAALAGPIEPGAWLDLAAEMARVCAADGAMAILMAGPPPPAAALRAAARMRPGDLLRLVLLPGAGAVPAPCLLPLRAGQPTEPTLLAPAGAPA